jgi:hypothetical protein
VPVPGYIETKGSDFKGYGKERNGRVQMFQIMKLRGDQN